MKILASKDFINSNFWNLFKHFDDTNLSNIQLQLKLIHWPSHNAHRHHHLRVHQRHVPHPENASVSPTKSSQNVKLVVKAFHFKPFSQLECFRLTPEWIVSFTTNCKAWSSILFSNPNIPFQFEQIESVKLQITNLVSLFRMFDSIKIVD